MTVASSNLKLVYDGNGSNKNFPVTFPYNSDADFLALYLTNEFGATSKVTSDFSINTNTNVITYPVTASAVPSTHKLTIIRETPKIQDTDFQNQGAFTPEQVERDFDKLVFMLQELGEQVQRCIRYSVEKNPSDADSSSFLEQVVVARNLALAYKEAASASAISAANSAASAAAVNESVVWNDVVFLTFASSPYIITNEQRGKFFSVDCSGGDVEISLPEISSLDLAVPFVLGIKKTDESINSIIVNPSASDTIDGSILKSITTQNTGATLFPDIDPSPDTWTSCDFGIIGSIGLSQGSRVTGLSLTEASQITPIPNKPIQSIFVKGNSGPITITNLNPITVTGMVVGQMITLCGVDDLSPVTFQSSDSLVLNGDAILKKDSVLTIQYLGSDGSSVSWLEIGRNF